MADPLARIRPALDRAGERPPGDASLTALAAETGLSPFYLHRSFQRAVGETPKQYALRLRLERAAALLLTSRATIMTVALDSGFESPEGFARAFRRRFGLAPSAYRERGFAAPTSPGAALAHAHTVARVGPCTGLYHLPFSTRSPMSYQVVTRTLAAQPVLLARRRVGRTEIAGAIGEVVGLVFQTAQERGIALQGHPFTRYPEFGPGLVTLEPGMRVADGGSASGVSSNDPNGVRGDELPGGLVATTLHRGPYDRLGEAYAALETWIDANGFRPRAAPWESYVTDPAENPEPSTWETEVFWPVAKG